jgi:ribonuclease G
MSKELVIGSNRHETKVAILEEDQLVEVYFQRANEYSLAGSIHKGRVTRVLPGMQSAFVDLGLERDTFLYVSDFFEENDDIDTVDEKPLRSERGGGRGERRERGVQDRQPAEIPAAVGEASLADEPTASMAHQEKREEEAPLAAADMPVPSVGGREAPANDRQADARSGQRGDRGDRGGGDRRGRRSRRRRGGRDFPENKYAQPNAGPAPAHEAPRLEPAEHKIETVAAESPAEDVMMLPGESLAKYRVRPPVPERRPAPTQFTPAAESAREFHEPEEVEQDLQVEAEEIKLSDQVFTHHTEAAAPMGDDQEGGRHDQVLGRAASYLGVDRAPAADDRDNEHTRVAKFLSDPSPASLPEADEHELWAAETSLPGLEDLAPEIEEALENGIDEPYITNAENAESTEQPAAQTAVVREQGGRSMHRMPRRMRRRRGGSGRFNQGQGGPGNAGAATSPQAEPRPDQRRETPTAVEERSSERPDRAMPSISELLKAGQEIIVQIAKEPLGQKGARITSHIALPGRYVVFMPSVAHLGVSRKVASEEERQRLKRILQTHRAGTAGGFIVRTAGEGVPEDEIAADMNFLYSLWLDIRQKAEKKPAPLLLHYDLDIVQRILRDQVTDEFKAIWVDNEDLYESVVNFMQRHQPALVNRVKMYTRNAPIFDTFNITQELEKALRPKVWLKSGGYIVINQTEALVAIDINTGKFVGKSNRLEDTIVKTNIEAVKEIVRQIRLRDLGGIIVVDFIDMDERKNRQRVMQALEEAMAADKAPYKILQFNDFGLVAITRKRVKQSLERTLCAPCPHCEGAGYVKSVQTIIGEILVEAQKIAKAIEGKDAMLRVHPEVAKVLKAKDNQYLEELEEILARPVLVKGDATLHHEKFDLG